MRYLALLLVFAGCTTIEQNVRVFWSFNEDAKALHINHTYRINKGYYIGCTFESLTIVSEYYYSGVLSCTDSDGYPTYKHAIVNPWSESVEIQ